MPLDPQASDFLEAYNQMESSKEPRNEETLAIARARVASVLRTQGAEVASVEDRRIPGPDGSIPIRIYRPRGEGPFPVLMYFHGGGWVLGSVETHDGIARLLANQGRCAVVSVDYRLAPEAKFPAGVEDCYSATTWAHEHASELNFDPARTAVGGDSSGGNLAAAVPLMAKDREGPPLIFQLLIYPVIERNFQTGSYQQNGDGYFLTRSTMEGNWRLYLTTDADAEHPYASPIKAKDLAGLPPALVITAEYDPLRDEGEAYANRLQAAHVPTTCTRYDGMIHGFFSYYEILDCGRKAIQEAAQALRAAFEK